jgi:hypothetical protein
VPFKILLLRRGAFDLDFAFSNSMHSIPVNLCSNDTAVRQADSGESFHFSPSSSPITPIEPPQIAHASVDRNDFDLFEFRKKFDLHSPGSLQICRHLPAP